MIDSNNYLYKSQICDDRISPGRCAPKYFNTPLEIVKDSFYRLTPDRKLTLEEATLNKSLTPQEKTKRRRAQRGRARAVVRLQKTAAQQMQPFPYQPQFTFNFHYYYPLVPPQFPNPYFVYRQNV